MKQKKEPIIKLINVNYSYSVENEPDDHNYLYHNKENKNDFSQSGEEIIHVFNNLTINIFPGITTLVGENGSGKTTFLLLAAARLYPDNGDVILLNKNTKMIRDEQEKNQLASFIYQNMEFESQESIVYLLNYVYENGYLNNKDENMIEELCRVFELKPIINRKLQDISKGELQRTILAMSLLYGSKIIIMDEPFFAMEQEQKYKAMQYIVNFARSRNVSVLYSVHELDISKKYSDYTVLFYKNKQIRCDLSKKLLVRQKLESAYGVPYGMLYQKEMLHRKQLMEEVDILKS